MLIIALFGEGVKEGKVLKITDSQKKQAVRQSLFEHGAYANYLQDLLDKCEEAEQEEDRDKIFAEYTKNKAQLTEVLIEAAKMILYKESTISVIKAEKKRLDKISRKLKNDTETLKRAINAAMATAGIKQVDDPLYPIKRKKKPKFVEVFDQERLDDRFKKIILTFNPVDGTDLDPGLEIDIREKYEDDIFEYQVMKSTILNNFTETGEIPDGVKIIEDATSITIGGGSQRKKIQKEVA